MKARQPPNSVMSRAPTSPSGSTRKPLGVVPSASFSVPMHSGEGMPATNRPNPSGGKAQTSASAQAASAGHLPGRGACIPKWCWRCGKTRRPAPKARHSAAWRSDAHPPPQSRSGQGQKVRALCAALWCGLPSQAATWGALWRIPPTPAKNRAPSAARPRSVPRLPISVSPAGRLSLRNGPGTARAAMSSRLTKLV
jgi:hypothetical protein